jgi:hypothetical protein
LVLKEIKVIEAISVSEFKSKEDFYEWNNEGDQFYRKYKYYIWVVIIITVNWVVRSIVNND